MPARSILEDHRRARTSHGEAITFGVRLSSVSSTARQVARARVCRKRSAGTGRPVRLPGFACALPVACRVDGGSLRTIEGVSSSLPRRPNRRCPLPRRPGAAVEEMAGFSTSRPATTFLDVGAMGDLLDDLLRDGRGQACRGLRAVGRPLRGHSVALAGDRVGRGVLRRGTKWLETATAPSLRTAPSWSTRTTRQSSRRRWKCHHDDDCGESRTSARVIRIDVEGLEFDVLRGARDGCVEYKAVARFELQLVAEMQRDSRLTTESTRREAADRLVDRRPAWPARLELGSPVFPAGSPCDPGAVPPMNAAPIADRTIGQVPLEGPG